MTGCFLVKKDTSVCVRFFTQDAHSLKPWIDQFEHGPCHVHCHDHIDTSETKPCCEDELKAWLTSSSSASAVMFLDSRMKHILERPFLDLCKKAKEQGVFIGVFSDNEKEIDSHILSLEPNWILPIKTLPKIIENKVNEILGVIRFTKFTKDKSNFIVS